MVEALSKKLPSLEELLKFIAKDIKNQNSSLSNITLIKPNDPYKEKVMKLLSENFKKLSDQESRALGCMISSAFGDALGAHTEFSPFCYDLDPKFQIKSFIDIKEEFRSKRSKIGQWTDDTSMALCLADSILENKGYFSGIDLRYRFLLWWHCGYNNGCKDGLSYGLGGNIKDSFRDFYKNPKEDKCLSKDKHQNGNGTLMRLAPVPIYFHNNELKGMEFAENQSYTTHTGHEASESCRLLTHLIIKLINRKGPDFKYIFDDLKNFETNDPAVSCLAKSCREKFDEKIHSKKFNQNEEDRNWDWKSEKYEYSEFRYQLHPDYFGSYCMDALALSLHFAYHSTSAKSAVLRAVNCGGDSDTIAAITGQIVGAIYGLEEDIFHLYEKFITQWDDWAIATSAYKLFYSNK